MAKNHYISGEWNVVCDVCSKKIKSHDARQRWDGFIVCKEDFEYRHPQDFVKAQTDKITVPFIRPQPPYVFVGEVSLNQNDTASATDSLLIGYALEVLTDALTASDIVDIQRSSTLLLLEENATATTAGTLIYQNYVDSTYLAEDYVSTTHTF